MFLLTKELNPNVRKFEAGKGGLAKSVLARMEEGECLAVSVCAPSGFLRRFVAKKKQNEESELHYADIPISAVQLKSAPSIL